MGRANTEKAALLDKKKEKPPAVSYSVHYLPLVALVLTSSL
jgi:hypothetical protein